MDGKSVESNNLLKWIKIDDDLRLNILLKAKPRTGISAIVDHCHPVDEYTRFMHIRYDDRRQELHGYSPDVRISVPSSQEFGATHVITAVTFGIDVVLVLQLPPKINSAQQIDVALEKIRRRLESFDEVFSLFEEYKSALEKIKKTTVYSNDGLLTEKKSLLQTCQYILETKQKVHSYRPVSYTLQYIDCSRPDCHKSSTLYVPLEGAASDKFELYILQILKYYKKTKHLLDSIKDESFPNNLNKKFLAVKTEWPRLQETYESAIKHLQKHVWTIHKSKNTGYQIDQIPGTEIQTTLKKNLHRLMHDLVGIESQLSSAKCSQDIYAKLFEPQENQTNNEQMLESVPNRKKVE